MKEPGDVRRALWKQKNDCAGNHDIKSSSNKNKSPNILIDSCMNMCAKWLCLCERTTDDVSSPSKERTLAATIFDVRTSFPFDRSWYVSPDGPAMVMTKD